MLLYNEAYLEYVRELLRGKMTAAHVATPHSWSYRKRAADLARQADSSDDVVEQTELVKRALSWIQLAENEEFMAIHHPVSNDNG